MSFNDKIISENTTNFEKNVVPPLLSKSPPSPSIDNSQNNENSLDGIKEGDYEMNFKSIDLNQNNDSKNQKEFNYSKQNHFISNNSNQELLDAISTGDLNQLSAINLKDSHNNHSSNLNWANFDTDSKIFEQNISNANENDEGKKIEESMIKHSNHQEDDDFADFVETSTLPNESFISVTAQAYCKTSRILQKNINLIDNKISSSNIAILDYDPLLENLFENLNEKTKSILQNFTKKSIETKEFIIDNNETWTELKNYTSVTDASISLKFKWILSNLEKNYLNSLNIERVTKIQNSKTLLPNLFKKELLQPVQMTSVMHDSKSAVNQISDSVLDLPIEISQLDSSSIKINQSTSTAFELDLSYFENKLDQQSLPNINKSSSNDDFLSDIQNTTTSLLSQQNNSKVHLDKLLKDIFVNTKNDTIDSNIKNNIKKEDEIQSDKKSLSSSSSSSSFSNINELAIQLQPHKLEHQQYLDMLQTNQKNDKKKLEILTKLPNYSNNLNNKSNNSVSSTVSK